MAEKQSKNKWHTPAERIMMLGFAAVILLGTILLCLPVSAADGKSVYWLDALFTATTSVCVTGLVTVPTATTWSTFGKIVILGLIQFRSWHHGVPDDGVSDPAPENQSAESEINSGYL